MPKLLRFAGSHGKNPLTDHYRQFWRCPHVPRPWENYSPNWGKDTTPEAAKGAKIVPSKYAVPVREEERAEQGIPKDKTGSKPPRPAAEERPQPAGTEAIAARSTGQKTLSDDTLEVAWITFATGCLVGALLRIKPIRKAVDLYTKNA